MTYRRAAPHQQQNEQIPKSFAVDRPNQRKTRAARSLSEIYRLRQYVGINWFTVGHWQWHITDGWT